MATPDTPKGLPAEDILPGLNGHPSQKGSKSVFSQNGKPVDVTFYPEPHSLLECRIDQTSRHVRTMPGEVRGLLRDALQVASELMNEKESAWREALEAVRKVHFGPDKETGRGFQREWHAVPFEGEQQYEAASKFREGSDVEKKSHCIVGIPGWFARSESFAEQAISPYLREFSQLYFNRVGTDEESSDIIKEAGYDPEKHSETNVKLLENLLDDAIEHKDIKTFTLAGHSKGGVLLQEAIEYFAQYRPDLLKRIDGVVLANTSGVKNVVQDSFMDRVPLAPEALRLGFKALGRVIVPLDSSIEKFIQVLPAPVANKVEPILPGRIMRIVASGAYIEHVLGHLQGDVIDATRYLAEKESNGLAMAYDGLTMLDIPDQKELKRLNKPVLIIEGENDDLFGPVTAHKLAKKMINGGEHHKVRHLVFPTGHCTQIEAAQQFNSVLYKFASDSHEFVRTHGSSKEYRLRPERRQSRRSRLASRLQGVR